MKAWMLLVLPLLSVLDSYACKCMQRSFAEEFQDAEQVFVGTPVSRVEGEVVSYTFRVSKIFKGAQRDSIIITTGFGGGDCGVRFVIGTSYLVYANDFRTNSCRRNAEDKNNPDVVKLAFLYDSSFNQYIAADASPELTSQEAAYLNVELLKHRAAFDFNGKKAAFLYNNKLVDKQQFFKQQGGREVVYDLLILTEAEKRRSNGYDVIVVFWRKLSVTKKMRKRIVRSLAA